MSAPEIDRMRADFPLAALAEGWSAGDQAEIGAAIKAAMDAGDAETIAYWSAVLAEAAGRWRAWCERVRQAEATMRVSGKNKERH